MLSWFLQRVAVSPVSVFPHPPQRWWNFSPQELSSGTKLSSWKAIQFNTAWWHQPALILNSRVCESEAERPLTHLVGWPQPAVIGRVSKTLEWVVHPGNELSALHKMVGRPCSWWFDNEAGYRWILEAFKQWWWYQEIHAMWLWRKCWWPIS